MISVITTCFNHPIDFLTDTVISLRAQSYTNFEWIVCADGCPVEPILSTIKKTLKKPSNLRCGVFGVNHGGRARAIDLAIKQSSGEFIVLVDSDDWLDPQCLKELADSTNHFDMIFGNHIEHVSGTQHPEISTFEHPLESAIDILLNPGVYFHPCLFRRSLYSAVGGTDRKLKACIDLELYLRMYGEANAVLKKPSAIYHYRKHQNQMGVTHQADQRATHEALLISYNAHP